MRTQVEWPADPTAKPTIVDANLMFGTTLSDGSTRASIEGAVGAAVDENAACEVTGIGGILSPPLDLDEFIAGVDTPRQGGRPAGVFCSKGRGGSEEGTMGTREPEEEEERWSDMSISETEAEK